VSAAPAPRYPARRMDPKLFGTVFLTVFLAELGDKTQLATLLYATDARHSRMAVFLASSSALVLSAGLGVLGGGLLRGWLNPRVLTAASGGLFLALGAWMLWSASRATSG
jgi:putative Ca2+/H+ antiporter (TMEM165/GDT1 family)